jgi:hypothetical protein
MGKHEGTKQLPVLFVRPVGAAELKIRHLAFID